MLDSSQRNLIVANRVGRIMGVLSFALCLIIVILFGPNINTPIIIGVGIFFFSIPKLNRIGSGHFGRVALCVVPVALTLTGAILAKVNEPGFTDILYYDTRFFLILLTIIPCLVFSTSEYVALYGCLGFILLCLVAFDPVHEYLGLGYFQMGFTGRSYYYINYAACLTMGGIAAGAISLKRVVERTEQQNLKFRQELIETNRQLHALVQNIETQNEEIIAQSDELHASQEQLMNANATIEKQKQDLQLEVKRVHSELVDANEELVKHNNELRQFSYTISHNLRGPIARLLGLTYLANIDVDVKSNSAAMNIISRIKTAASELDHVVHDLNEIVDIRNEIFQENERVDFIAEWQVVASLLQISNDQQRSHFQIDFSQAEAIYSVRPMISSILFNLISNALKYQSPQRPLQVTVHTFRTDTHTIIEVSDNGLGIDLTRFDKDLFKMYKRFHLHQEGKGLGLYLIKSQAEFLNGSVHVTSEPEMGSTFTVAIKEGHS